MLNANVKLCTLLTIANGPVLLFFSIFCQHYEATAHLCFHWTPSFAWDPCLLYTFTVSIINRACERVWFSCYTLLMNLLFITACIVLFSVQYYQHVKQRICFCVFFKEHQFTCIYLQNHLYNSSRCWRKWGAQMHLGLILQLPAVDSLLA